MSVVGSASITITDITDAYHLLFTKDTLVIPTAADGSGGVFDASTATTAAVYLGGVDDSANWVFSVTPTNVTGTSSESNKVYTLTGMSADTGSVSFQASKAGFAMITKIFTVSKSKAGAAGPALTLLATKLAFTATDGALDAGQSDITFTAVKQNVSGTSVFTSSPTVTLSGSGETRALSAANFGTNRQVTVTVTVGAYSDNVTVMRLDNAATAMAWVKPSTTNIDGNKIHTGDAYVDTLQIKGNAVIVPQLDYSHSETSKNTLNLGLEAYVWEDTDLSLSVTVPTGENYPLMIIANLFPTTCGAISYWRIIRGTSTEIGPPSLLAAYPENTYFGTPEYLYPRQLYYQETLTAGTYTYKMQVKGSFTYVERALVLISAKR